MTEAEKWAYLAGVIDGEGSLSMAVHILVNGKAYSLRPVLAIGNTDKSLIEFCQSMLGGNIFGQNHNRKHTYYRLDYQGYSLYDTLVKLKPYLIAKKKVAELILKYIDIRNMRGGPYTRGYSEMEISLANEIRSLTLSKAHRARQIPLQKVSKNKSTTQGGKHA